MDIAPQTRTSALPFIQLSVLMTECAEHRLALRGSQAVGLTEMPLRVGEEGGPGSGLWIEQPARVQTRFCYSSCVTLGLWPSHSEPPFPPLSPGETSKPISWGLW